jgi:hypothetical protein
MNEKLAIKSWINKKVLVRTRFLLFWCQIIILTRLFQTTACNRSESSTISKNKRKLIIKFQKSQSLLFKDSFFTYKLK